MAIGAGGIYYKAYEKAEPIHKEECQDVWIYDQFPKLEDSYEYHLKFILHHSNKIGYKISLEDSLKIIKAIEKYNNTYLDNLTILTIILIESHFKKEAFNPVSKDYGIAQINYRTFEGLCKDENCDIENLFDIDYNIKFMCRVLKDKEQRIIKSLKLKIDNPRYNSILMKALIMSYNSGFAGYMSNYHDTEDSKYYKVVIGRLDNWYKINQQEINDGQN
jgi:hypothetical protein